ncbi:hypothetical protein JCM11491_002642 [Sporobolomyces phaffii]
MTLKAVLLFPLHLGVLLVLHTAFASIRLLVVVSQQFQSSRHQSTRTRSTPAADLATNRWTKVPRHLAVVLAPGTWREGQITRLIKWCRELGIAQLTLYDRQGHLVANADRIALLDPNQPLVVKHADAIVTLVPAVSATPPKPEQLSSLLLNELDETASSDGTGSATLIGDVESSTPPNHPKSTSSSSFTLRLLSRSAGRPQIAKLAQTLAVSRRRQQQARSTPLPPLSSEKVAQVIDSFPLPEPDLVFVFGGSYLRLSGFPPWQIRLSEMYHYASPIWLPAPELRYEILRSALDVYGRAEMRLGR